MNRADIRRTNLLQLKEEAKTIAAIAEKAGCSEKYISQLINAAKLPSGAPRGIGNRLARRLEAAFEKQPGWMDIDHDALAEVSNLQLSTTEMELLMRFRAAKDKNKRAIMAVARL